MLQLVQKLADGNFGHPVGHPGGVRIPNHDFLFTQWGEVLKALGPGPWTNLYVTTAHHVLEPGKIYTRPQRTSKTFEYQTVLAFDIDHCDVKRAFEYCGAVAKVLKIEPNELTLVCTGNGVHIYAHLATPIRSLKYFQELKPAYNELCSMIEAEIVKRELPLDRERGGKVDPVVFEPARILRVPNTINQKAGKPDTECLLLQYSPKAHEIDLKKLSGLDKIEAENISPAEIRRQYPKPDFPEIVKECRFISWSMEKPEEVHEPQAFALIGLMAAQEPGQKVVFNGREMTAREVAQHVFENASNSASCQSQDFDKKWEAASRYGAQKCSTIANHWIGGCQTCPHNSRIPTPLALRSPDHVGTAALGYWETGKNGKHLNPHYGDLARVYRRQHSYITTTKERILTFGGTHYRETSDLEVKAWLERTIDPVDPLREAHRNEFVHKVRVAGGISDAQEHDLFDLAIEGKLNCRNGVLDIVHGQMLPHSPKYGFQYVLPYDYVPDGASELFLDWLATIAKDRIELMDAIMDMMAYCLWPRYDDHVFFCLVGTGANGKSTLLHIIQAMIGRGNFSAVSMQQLGQNRFAPANLEGKLANLSEESSGYELNYEELNVLQNLSAGGEMEVERKGQQGFTFRNKAKMIFSANKPPRFKDTGHALRRRLVVIPFDHTITNPDPTVERRLIEEVPLIVSMLIRRIQENTVKNGGRFIVARGGVAAAEAQRTVLLNGNSVVEWAKEKVFSSSDVADGQYLVVGEAFNQYKMWCEDNNYRAVNAAMFSHFMYTFVVTPSVDRNDNRVYVGNKRVRVFKRTTWKNEE